MSGKDTPVSSTGRDASHYNMRHPKRGMALIFNHEVFKDNYADRRTGTNIDCQNLTTCLTKLGFEVEVYHNLDFKDIRNQLKRVSEIDHTNHDCLVVTILTHGDTSKLFAHDVTYDSDIVWSYFTADRCQSLAGKPKLFFIQACRGKKLDHGMRMMERTETDSAKTFRIPCHADFLIAYATIPGYYAWRIPSKGSWFISALCTELSQGATQVDLLTLLTFVCQRVALGFESYDPDDPDRDMKKQVPCITSMLTRLVRF